MLRLKNTKVLMYSSEQNISDLLHDFDMKCMESICDECKVVNNKKLIDKNECRARYIYERIINTK